MHEDNVRQLATMPAQCTDLSLYVRVSTDNTTTHDNVCFGLVSCHEKWILVLR
jgi:hypothetical protein